MNNMKYYNDSLAYDFEMFAEKPAKKTHEEDNNIVLMPKDRYVTRKRAAKRLSPMVAFAVLLIFFLVSICGTIALRLEINEVNDQIKDIKSEIAELDSVRTSLEMELQRRISYVNLEEEATRLGMIKPNKDNVVYIRVNDKDIAKTKDGTVMISQ